MPFIPAVLRSAKIILHNMDFELNYKILGENGYIIIKSSVMECLWFAYLHNCLHKIGLPVVQSAVSLCVISKSNTTLTFQNKVYGIECLCNMSNKNDGTLFH